MSSGYTGSSSIYGLTLNPYPSSSRGPTGFTGPSGTRGATGASIIGRTGPAGASLVDVRQLQDNRFEFYFSDSTTKKSNTVILGPSGNTKVSLTGTSLGVFSLLADKLKNTSERDQYPTDVLTFKGLSTAAAPYITIRDRNGNEENTFDKDLIEIEYNTINIGYVGLSGGTLGNIIQNLPGQFQAGITSTFYNETEDSVLIQHRNIQEALNICRPTVIGTNLAVWKIDPSLGSVFFMIPYTQILTTSTEINGMAFLIKKPSNGYLSKGISLHFDNSFTGLNRKIYYATYENDSDVVDGITFGSVFFQKFDAAGVEWQNDSYFCPDSKFNVLNLISLGGRYLAIPAQYNQNSSATNTEITATNLVDTCYPYEVAERSLESSYFDTGLCCHKNCNVSNTRTNRGGCTGQFYSSEPIGSSICSTRGACCIRNFSTNKFTQLETTYCNCATLANNSPFSFNVYGGLKTSLSDFDCNFCLFNDSGACCDGLGGCETTTRSECSARNGFFQGTCTNCSKPICAGGTGACCNSGISCLNGISFDDCLSSNRTYFGDRSRCDDFNCTGNEIPCGQIIEGTSVLEVGDEFAGGIVAGLFDPSSSLVFGNIMMSGDPYDTTTRGARSIPSFSNIFNKTSSIVGKNYQTRYDFGGYGVDKDFGNRCDTENDKYIIIVSKNDLVYNNTNEFVWSKKQNMWGGIYNPATLENEEFLSNTNDLEGHLFEYNDNKFEIESDLSTDGNSPGNWVVYSDGGDDATIDSNGSVIRLRTSELLNSKINLRSHDPLEASPPSNAWVMRGDTIGSFVFEATVKLASHNNTENDIINVGLFSSSTTVRNRVAFCAKNGTWHISIDSNNFNQYSFDTGIGVSDYHTFKIEATFALMSIKFYIDSTLIKEIKVGRDVSLVPNNIDLNTGLWYGVGITNKNTGAASIIMDIQPPMTGTHRKAKLLPTGNYSLSDFTSLEANTFNGCAVRNTSDSIEWLTSVSSEGITGRWRRNYGLYNTARMCGSKLNILRNIQGYSRDSSIDGTEIVDAIMKYNQDNPPTENYESSWFIPSHDEMGYISRLCQDEVGFNLNSIMAINGYEQINGIYWTSTGSFNYNFNEGIKNSPIGATHGTQAWSYSIDSSNPAIKENANFVFNNSTIKGRQNTYKVRPIKIIRCDRTAPASTDPEYKLWRLPIELN